MLLQALSKLEKEIEGFKGGTKEMAVYKPVADALKSFAKQDAEFAQAIAQSDKTLSDCCKKIMSGVGDAVSDIDVYRQAVRFYFAGAEVEMHMTVKVNPAGNMPENSDSNIINLSFADLFD